VYETPESHWVKLATMNFSGSADFWMQSIEVDLKKCTWDHLCKAVIARFERDQHNQIIRQFFHISQTGSVPEYIEEFDELVHQLLAHDPYFNPSVVTSRFVDGLKSDIKSVVLVHRPKDLDTASSLAILQEEVIEGTSIKEKKSAKVESQGHNKTFGKSSGNSPSKNTELNKQEGKKSPYSSKGKAQGEKASALMAYRKAKGLCYKCGEKWGPQHSCPDSVPLHLVEELWQMVVEKEDQSVKSLLSETDSDSGEDIMAVSVHAVNGTYASKTIKFMCNVQQFKAVMLMDSGSSHNFISEQFATNFPNWKRLDKSIDVKVADGGLLKCTHEVEAVDWLVQGTQFKTNFKILPIKCYDAILGMDWLETLSPMKVHWAKKWFSFTYQGKKVRIEGLLDGGACHLLSGDQLLALQKHDEI
jgi:hypothetical protein